MGFSNGLLSSKSEKSQKGDHGDKGQGFRLTADQHFHLENKRLTNLAPPVTRLKLAREFLILRNPTKSTH